MVNEAVTNITLILVVLAISAGIAIPIFYLFVSRISHKRLSSHNRSKIKELIDRVAAISVSNGKK